MICDILKRLRNSDKIALVCRNEFLSYKQWNQLSENICNQVIKKQRGKAVGLFLNNSIAYAVSYFACLYADKVVVPFHTGCTMDEVLRTIKHCSITTLVTSESYISAIEALTHENQVPLDLIILKENGEFVRQIASATAYRSCQDIEDNELNDVVVLLHTSGTTSRPKRVMLTNGALLSNIRAHCKSLDLDENEVCLIQLPMMFGYCNTAQFLAHVYLGARIVINPYPFMVADFYTLVETWKITNFTAVPTILIALLHSTPYYHDISSLKMVCFGGSAISKSLLSEIINKFPSIAFIQTYGLTEAGPRVTTLPPSQYIEKIGSVGKAIDDVRIKIVDSTGNSTKPGEPGEILVKSAGLMKGYYRCHEDTNKVIKKNWLYTGDIGYLSDDAFLYITGRKKNIIITGGQNICPEEVEEVIMSCSGIIDVKVYGKPDNLLGEIVCADIVIDYSHSGAIEQLKLNCTDRLSKYKIPKQFNIVDSICRTYNGKIKRSIEGVGL